VSSSPAPVKADPFQNPSYPKRTHFAEKKELEEKLRMWDQKIEATARKLEVLGGSPDRPALVRLYHQAMGARDQFAEAAGRLPREAGALYEEDRERLEIAEEALTRLSKHLEAAGL
jgi:hypothetical protein